MSKAEKAFEGDGDAEGGISIVPMDLADPASVDAFVDRFLAEHSALHILINNAGIMALPLHRDARGMEAQFATNHLGHFQLTLGLWPALQKAGGARIVSVSSWGHRHSPVVLDDPNFERRTYTPWLGYGQSKTANVLLAVEADARGMKDGIRAFSLHPGSIVETGLGKHISQEDLKAAGVIDENGKAIHDPSRNFKKVEQGAATSVWCATSPQLDGMGGLYCENCDVAPLVVQDMDEAARKFASRALGVMPYAVDPDAAKKLWSLSEQLLAR
jgi:NAD(P)-dependent dehydrogenase (short-subunit alcohol dehydrogenase family)